MLRVVLTVILGSSAAFAQNVISAKAGLVNYHDGDVQIGGEPVVSKPSTFTSIKAGQELRTGEGRVEVLLTPGVFLRMGENSAFRMISNSLSDPKIALIAGSALIQAMDVAKDTPITVVYGDRAVLLAKSGIYRFDVTSEVASLRVYEGDAKVGDVDVKRGREIALSGNGETREIAKFDTKDTDELYRWASRRDQYIAMANVSAAKSAGSFDNSGTCGSSFGTGYGNASWLRGVGFASAGNTGTNGTYSGNQGGWRYNPCYGMYTYLPRNGIYTSPFGWNYFSPRQVVYVYNPRLNGGGLGGGNSGFVGHGGTRGGGLPPMSAPTGPGVGSAPGNAIPAGAAPSTRAAAPGGLGEPRGSAPRGPR